MIAASDLVCTKLGWSGPGLVVELVARHPRLDEQQIKAIRRGLNRPHALVMWCDVGAREWIAVDKLKKFETNNERE